MKSDAGYKMVAVGGGTGVWGAFLGAWDVFEYGRNDLYSQLIPCTGNVDN